MELVHSSRKICHKLVAKTAKEICNEVFEICSTNDRFHARWPLRVPFVARFWKDYIGHARLSLTKMLTMPDSECSPLIKEQIAEALILEGGYKARKDYN